MNWRKKGIFKHAFIFCILTCLYSFCQLFQNDDAINADDIKSKWEVWSNGTQLRGANIYQRKVYPELDGNEFLGSGRVGPPYTQEDFNRLSAKGANYVNISHPGIFTEKPPYTVDADILENLEKLIEMIGQADMFVVISFRTGPGRSEFTFFWGEDGDWFDSSYYNDRIWVEPDAQNSWIAMWEKAASVFLNNPYVVGYDLMVEPNANDVWLDSWDPQEFYDNYSNTLYDWNCLFPRIVSAIRNVDTETPILCGGMAYSAVDWLPYVIPVSDAKTLYTFHQYDPHIYTHQDAYEEYCYPGTFDLDGDGTMDSFTIDWLKDLLASVDEFRSTHEVITAVNEYGVKRWACNAADFMDDQMGLFEEKKMNYALWVWEPAWEPWSSKVDDFNFCFGPDPENTGNVDTSELIQVIEKYWGKNTIRPSQVEFKTK